MGTILFTNSAWGIPLLLSLHQTGCLKGVVVPDFDHEALHRIVSFAAQHQIPFFKTNERQLHEELPLWLDELECSMGVCLAFPYRLPSELLRSVEQGVFNFHFGKLPEYAGGDPVFWMIKNQQKTAAITVHKMSEVLDCGEIYIQEQVTIYPGENHGLLGARLSQISAQLLVKLIDLVENKVQGKPVSKNPSAYKRPTIEQLTIDWNNQTADAIEALVNAANPAYGGAITYFRNSPVRILETSPADVPHAALLYPGTVVHANVNEGLFVLCSDYRFLKINIIQTPEAIITGNKLVALGVKLNEKFGKPILAKATQLVK